jgi:predicted RNase H-like nuclease (RuvC/YqgF family)
MAIEEVNRIIDSLRDSLDDMESVLEMLEQFERQSNADEREIESLRRALRHLQRPRDGGHSHRGR